MVVLGHVGHFEHTIDDKGRLVLPAAFRPAFAEGGVVTFLGSYAALFTDAEWEKYWRRLELSGAFSRTQLQYTLSLTSPVAPDSQHRIGLSPQLREVAGLEREVTAIGSQSHVALYARSVWQDVKREVESPDESGRTMADAFASLEFL